VTPGKKFVELDKRVHDRKSFCCGVEVLDNFIRSNASKHRELKISRTMVLPATEAAASTNLYPIAAFYTTTQTTIERQTLTAKLAKSLPSYPVPVFIIPCLAVDQTLQGQGLGSDALTVALRELYHASKGGISGIGVAIDPLDDRADAIYRNFGFETLTENRLFLGMKTVEKIIESL
jgi:hypothetical protein